MNVETMLTLKSEKKQTLFNDATKPDILIQAGIKHVAYLVITLPDATAGQTIVTVARRLNPQVKILMRARYLSQGELLLESGADAVCYDEAEVATAPRSSCGRTSSRIVRPDRRKRRHPTAIVLRESGIPLLLCSSSIPNCERLEASHASLRTHPCRFASEVSTTQVR